MATRGRKKKRDEITAKKSIFGKVQKYPRQPATNFWEKGKWQLEEGRKKEIKQLQKKRVFLGKCKNIQENP